MTRLTPITIQLQPILRDKTLFTNYICEKSMKIGFLILTAAIIFFSDCSSKFNLTKRKYNKGYYFSISKNVSSNKVENNQKLIVLNCLQKKDVVLYKHESLANDLKNSFELNGPILKYFESNSKKPLNTLNAALVSANNKNIKITKYSVKQLSDINLKKQFKNSQTTDTDLVVQIILSLFPIICLIAIYLHDNKIITINFFVDLLLHLTFIGAIVFALLVVLDIVELK